MRVAFYAPLKAPTHPVPSGDRAIASDLWESFRAKGHECLLLSDFRTPWFYQSPARILSAGAHWAAAAARAARFRPDLFFTYHLYYKAPDPIGASLAALWRRPYVLFEASHAEKPRESLATAPGYWLSRWAIQSAAHAFSDVADDLPELRELLPRDRVSFVSPCVDAARFRPDPAIRARWRREHAIKDDELVVACAAMLRADRKADGVRFLIEALADLKNQGVSARLAVAGGGECFDSIKALAQSRLNGSSLMLGAVSREEVADLLRAADVFAFPGIDEAFGLAYLEAQASGLPVVAFRNGGVPEAVADGVCGVLTPPMDRRAYAEALAAFLKDEALRRRMGLAARERMLQCHDPRTNYGAVVERCEALAGKK